MINQCLWRLKLLSQALFREIEVANRDGVKPGIRLRFSRKYVCLSILSCNAVPAPWEMRMRKLLQRLSESTGFEGSA